MSTPAKSLLLEQARTLEKAGRFKDAEATLLAAIKAAPRDPAARLQIARLYNRKLHTSAKTIEQLPVLLKLAPRLALTHELAAEAYFNLRRKAEATKHADLCVKLGPKSPDGLYVAATIYYGVNLFPKAVGCMQSALELRPDHLPSKILLAESLRAEGKLAEAEALCREIFKTYPDSLPNLSIWSATCKQTADDPIYLHLRDSILPQLRQNTNPRIKRILTLLGKAELDIGNFDQAFLHYQESKTLGEQKHDRNANRLYVSNLISGISKSDFFGSQGNPDETPVLIVGMPRTGSTLLEQILASHPAIGGVGENEMLRKLAASLNFQNHNGTSAINAIKAMTPEKSEELAQIYLKELRKNHPKSVRIVDKNLHNFELLWFFGKLFPKARIINALRDPMDNCVSCYMAPLSKFHSYTWDLTSLGQYYREFRSLMTHWKSVVPNPILGVSYEDTVADTEGTARRVIDFLGLEWDPACLDFQKSENRAKTISVWQVRQPVYNTSVKRWKRYETHLDPLKKELAEFYPNGFD